MLIKIAQVFDDGLKLNNKMLKIIPTDTCYGLAGNLEKTDFERIYALKGRENTKRLAIMVRDFFMLWQVVKISPEQIQILKNYSFPFSVILPRNPEYNFPEFLKIDNYEYISVRIWEKCLKKEILENLNFPLFLTSANISWQPETMSFSEARNIFPEINGFDGGVCDAKPSNIFSFWENNELIFVRKNYE